MYLSLYMGTWGLAHSLYGTVPTAGAVCVPYFFSLAYHGVKAAMTVCFTLGSIPAPAHMIKASQLSAICLTLVGIPGLSLLACHGITAACIVCLAPDAEGPTMTVVS